MPKSLAQLIADAKAEGWAEWIRSEADERAVFEGCRFKRKWGEHVCQFFETYLRLGDGQWAGEPFRLLPWQRDDVVMPLFSWARADGTRRFRDAYVSCAKKNGKALACDTPVATPSGWATMGDLQAGDEVFSDTGLPCRVVATHGPFYDHDCFRVTFSDGESIIADAGHRWAVRDLSRRNTVCALTTADMADSVSTRRDGARNCALAIAEPQSRHITSIAPIPSVPVRCITVDAPSHLFLAGRSFIPTHNSPLAAGIGLYLLAGDKEPGAKIASVATEIQQANIVHQEAIRMVKASPELRRAMKINHTTSNIAYVKNNGWYRAFSGQVESKEGYNLHGAVADELHVWRGFRLLDTLRYAFISRRQPLFFKITTAGVFDETSVGYEEYLQAKRVQTGEAVDLEKFVYIAEPEPNDDWTAEASWAKANPSLGEILRVDELAKACDDAKANPRLENEFRRYRLNQWTEQAERWLNMEAWNECSGDPDIPDGATVTGCGDLSSKLDLTAFVVCYRDDDDVYHVKPYCWLPSARLTETHNNPNQKLYQMWARERYLETTPGEVVDYGHVRKRIRELAEQYNIPEIGFDPWNATQVMTELEEQDGFTVFEYRQGYVSMNDPSKELEKLVKSGKLRHGGHPILAWAAQNAAVKEDPAGNIKPCKPGRNSPLKIDPLVACVMAIGRAMVLVDEPSPYSDGRDLLVL